MQDVRCSPHLIGVVKLRQSAQEWFSYKWRSLVTMAPEGLKVMWLLGEFHGVVRNPKPLVLRYESVKTKFNKMSLSVILQWFLAAFATTSQQKAAGFKAEMLIHFEPLERVLMSLIRTWQR